MIKVIEQETSRLNQCPSINVSFALSGKQLPADHGYLVYSAISRSSPSLHGIDWLAIELISGFPSGCGLIHLPERDAILRLRIPADHYRDVLLLAGKRLDISGHQIRLGLPVARPLEPASSLYARVVTIKKFTEPEPFIAAVKRKLDSFGVKGRVELPLDEQGRYRRRIVTIHGKSVVGFSVAVHDLNDEDSILLQAGAVKIVSPDNGAAQWQNIFSRRAMGCGIFNPISAAQGK
ncbi:MAG TPA: type I-MYXAN CRISPR-associated protein Cas6/Cmx6 [Pyrinomonadaceae bacterium]|nr:type I-MYXAN CRISPR-associated protein Cas6/Cmx6 [Pyrinomonadaceae bacterium]